MSAVKQFIEEAYAQFRLEGMTHEQAMKKVSDTLAAATPIATKNFLDEVLGPETAPQQETKAGEP